MFSADSDLQLWPIPDASTCIIGPGDGTFTWRFVSHANGSRLKQEFWKLCFIGLDIFSVIEITRGGQEKSSKTILLCVTIKLEKKGRGYVVQVLNWLGCWACNCDLQISYLQVDLFIFLRKADVCI